MGYTFKSLCIRKMCIRDRYFMQLKYVDTKEEIIAINRKSKHIEPHLHDALEIVCVTSCLLYTSRCV